MLRKKVTTHEEVAEKALHRVLEKLSGTAQWDYLYL